MPDLKYRYLAEDIPTGLYFAKGLAEIVGLETPTIDKVMKWGQERRLMVLEFEGFSV